MKLERQLQICVATMAVLGTVLLGIEQHDATLSVVVFFAAVTSVLFTDALGWFALHHLVANALALIAVIHTVLNVTGQATELQLLTVADLLVYLQLILLYQVKTPRLYWQLMALSLLQVVVAAALNLIFVFGILLILYLFVALAAMSLFFMYREGARARSGQAEASVAGRPAAWQDDPLPTFEVIRRDTPVLKGLLRQTSWMGLITLVTTVAVFFLLPRHEAIWKRHHPQRQRLVGFTEDVSLDDLGPILESRETVMRVSFTDYVQGRPYVLWSEPYFRGAVLVGYLPRVGRWTRPTTRARSAVPAVPGNPGQLVRQEIVLDNTDHRVLFAVMPARAVGDQDRRVRWDSSSELLVIDEIEEKEGETRLRFVFATDAFQRGVQKMLRPATAVPRAYELAAYTYFDGTHQMHLSQLELLAEDVLANARVDADDVLGKVRALEAHFLAAGRYKYSLDNSKERDRERDPVEDFVSNHRTGHCEYFASALTLMLRSQGIPARMVIGYKGGEYNTIGSYYQVRQLHAHAWVETYLFPDQMEQLHGRASEAYQFGAWLRLDPTSGTIDAGQGLAGTGILSWLAHWADYAQLLWSDYVLGMNSERQRRAIYQPLVSGARATLEGLFHPAVWEERLRALARWLGLYDLGRRRFDWQLLLMTLPLAIGLLAAVRLLLGTARKTVSRLWRWIHYPLTRAARTDSLFRRMEKLLARRGLARPAGQTPLEFAWQVQQRLRADLPEGGGPYADLPGRIVDALYQTRFGGRTLDSQLLDRLQHDLAGWEKLLGRRAL